MKKKSRIVSFDLGLHCDYLLTMQGGKVSPLRDQFVGIKKGKIIEVSKWNPSRTKQCKRIIDGARKVCLPGLINGHAHLAMNLFRGLEDDVPFHKWLFERILPLESALVSKEFVRAGTALALLESIRFGTTTVQDMYFFVDAAAGVVDAMGMRAVLAQPFASIPLPEDKVVGSDKFLLVRQLQKKYLNHPRLRIDYGPHAPYTCEDSLLERIAQEAKQSNSSIHIHLSETKREVEESIAKFGVSPVVRLQKLGILGPKTSCAHGVHLSEQDREILKNTGASVIHNPDSNTKLNSGISPIFDLMKRRIPIGLGTDGAASNNDLSIWGAIELATKLQKSTGAMEFRAEQALLAATIEGARALQLHDQIGSIEVGKSADLIFVDLTYPHMQPVYDFSSQLVYSTTGLEVDTVIIEGKILLKERKFQSLPVEEIYSDVEKWRKKIHRFIQEVKAKEKA